jgi:hypothetical protein
MTTELYRIGALSSAPTARESKSREARRTASRMRFQRTAVRLRDLATFASASSPSFSRGCALRQLAATCSKVAAQSRGHLLPVPLLVGLAVGLAQPAGAQPLVGLNGAIPASALHPFSCDPLDANGKTLPYDGPFICYQIDTQRRACELLRKQKGVPTLNMENCFGWSEH